MSTDPETPTLANGSDHPGDDQADSDGEDEVHNDTTMHDDEEVEGDQTLQNGKSYAMAEEATDYSVFANPPDLGRMRQRLFDLEEPIEVTVAEFEAYYSFVDNIWRKMRSGEQPDSSLRTEYYACRLRRTTTAKPHIPRPTPEGKQSRKKRIRDDKTCGMTMKVVYNSGPASTCTISRGVDNFQKHSHDLDYIDSTKRNSGIMDTARREATRGFLPASIYWKMWEEPDKMHAAGGKWMKVSDVRNVQYAWRQENQQTVLKAHTGFNQTRAPRQRPATPPKPAQPSVQPGVFGRLEPSKPEIARLELPPVQMDTLQYPQHARGFLEQYLPDPNLAASRGRPHVTLTWASGLDGRITQVPGVPTAISGPETKAMTHYLRSCHDAILIGVTTAIADDPALNCRLANPVGYGGLPREYQPRPIIIDPHARLHIRPEMKILKAASEGRGKGPWVVVAPGAMLHPMAVSTLKAHGGEYLMINDYHPQSGGLNWEGVFHVLFREGIKSVMIEGGGIVLSELLKVRYAHVIDSVIMTIAPTFFGKAGVPVSPDPTFDYSGRPIATRLKKVRWQPMGDADVVLCGQMVVDRPANGILPGIEEFSQAAPEPNQQQRLPPPPQEQSQGSPPSQQPPVQYPQQPPQQPQPPAQQANTLAPQVPAPGPGAAAGAASDAGHSRSPTAPLRASPGS
ncbi:5-amino-6-uracil reductase [Exophiala viscosa]|uniref:2,5-diamino-6-ribosylamino-4(3H)-pyrimidinone 5'-phosphate reductase n=1 Tax=Exophiala viscosa TaxID=2486360 RepID=A0AAN6IIK6_9EURO|nr:5-amino-6-uracil reductase [Exophiala viscosa]